MSDWLPAEQTTLNEMFPKISPPPVQKRTLPSADPAIGFGRDGKLVYPSNPPRSPHFAWLNILGPGIAQIVFGKSAMGISMIVIVNFIQVTSLVETFPGAALMLALFITSIIDAYMTGSRLRDGQPVGKWQFFPTKKK